MTTIHGARPAQRTDVIIETSEPRATPRPVGSRFREVLDDGASALLTGVESAAAFVPGGGAVSAAIRGARSGSAGGESPLAPGAAGGAGSEATEMQDVLRQAQDQSMMYLQLQEQISAENRRYTALSNVLKAQHETAKAAINNIR